MIPVEVLEKFKKILSQTSYYAYISLKSLLIALRNIHILYFDRTTTAKGYDYLFLFKFVCSYHIWKLIRIGRNIGRIN